MTTLMVTPFAPYRDGIAAYAQQELRRLREEGEIVEVLSPLPSAARWHLPLGGPSAMAHLVAKARDFDRVVIHFAPEMVFGRCGSALDRLAVWASMASLGMTRPLDLRIHELDYGALAASPIECRAARAALERAARITVHTEAERDELVGTVGLRREVEVLDHGLHFRPAVARSRAEARRELGLAPGGTRFVAIGFLQHHKGFDVAVDALDRLHQGVGDEAVHLDVVGSARIDHPEVNAYVDLLRGRCAEVANATLHERFVSDVEFDLWIQAADAVVLPYREIWSSSVLERAAMFNVAVLASNLPQLEDQAPPGTRFFSDVDGLAAAMEQLRHHPTGGSGRPAESGLGVDTLERRTGWIVDPLEPDREAIQQQIARRATRASDRDRSSAVGSSRPLVGSGTGSETPVVEVLAAVGSLSRPPAHSARPGAAGVKRLVDRLVSWRVDPMADHLESLQRATTEAVERLERRVSAAETDRSGPVVR